MIAQSISLRNNVIKNDNDSKYSHARHFSLLFLASIALVPPLCAFGRTSGA
jgi:hypothetical protein